MSTIDEDSRTTLVKLEYVKEIRYVIEVLMLF